MSRPVPFGVADVGIALLLVYPDLPRLPQFGQFRRVTFKNPFTDRATGLHLLRPDNDVAGRRALTARPVPDLPHAHQLEEGPACAPSRPGVGEPRRRHLLIAGSMSAGLFSYTLTLALTNTGSKPSPRRAALECQGVL
jgi:hypothetical protein